MATITFQNPDILIFLVGIPIIIFAHLISQRYAKTRALLFANFEAVRRVVGKKKDIANIPRLSGNWSLLLFRIITYTILVLAVAGTTIWTQGYVTEQDYVLAVDASGSMLAQDILPSRFEAAKSSALYFIESLQGTGNIGVIAFAGTPLISHPMTDNHNDIMVSIDEMQISRMSGTDIASTLMLGTNMLMQSERPRSMIILTDGRQTVATPLNPAIEYARDNGIVVHMIGIGTEEGGAFTDEGLITSIDAASLEIISNQTGGTTYIVRDDSEMRDVFRVIADLQQGIRPFNLAYYLMLAAFIMLFLEWGLLNTVFRNLP
ncbi:MAG: VWA domain-containing protein [Candidatus Woesearchaeota archaeon]